MPGSTEGNRMKVRSSAEDRTGRNSTDIDGEVRHDPYISALEPA
jgi:hypothetical protein